MKMRITAKPKGQAAAALAAAAALSCVGPRVGLARGFAYTPSSGVSWRGLMNPNLWEYQLLVADARARAQSVSQKERLKAEKLLKHAKTLEPRRPEALAALADLYLKWGRWSKAVEAFQALEGFYRETMPRSLVFLTAVARARAGDYGKAAQAFKSLVRERDGSSLRAKLWNNAALAAMAAGRLTRALDWFDRAIRADRGYRPALYGRAVALLRDGQIEAAAGQLAGLVRLEADLKSLYVRNHFFLPPADRWFFLAAVLEIQACRKEADGLWKRYFAGVPQSPWEEVVRRFRKRAAAMGVSRSPASWCQKRVDAAGKLGKSPPAGAGVRGSGRGGSR